MSKKKINCNVVNCKFNDDEEYLCCLDDIEISCTCNNEKCKNKKETICNSFHEKDIKEPENFEELVNYISAFCSKLLRGQNE